MMAQGAFPECHEVTAKWEGGWSNHPDDPGGATNLGITQATYSAWRKATGKPKKSVKYITVGEAKAIYRQNYWNAASCETLFSGVDLATYDASVNSGVGRGRKWLLAALDPHDNHVRTVKNICARRLGFMQSLKIWKTFGRGWSRRVADVEAKGVAWAMAAVSNTNVTKKTLDRESEEAFRKAGKQAGGGAAAGGGGAVATPEMADQMAAGSLVVFLVIAALVVGFILWRAKINKERGEAYRKEAAKL